jgi:alkylation response protein AidB-like acyl-CoA dehydrogenase
MTATPATHAPARPPVATPLDAATRVQLEEGLDRFSRERYTRSAWQAYGGERDGYSAAIWRSMAGLGWLSLGLPESVGGVGPAIRDLVPVFCAAGRALWREPLLQALGEACGAMLALPPCEARDHLLSEIACGGRRPVFARPTPGSTVTARHRPKDLSGYAIRGHIAQLPAADSCTDLIVPARSDAGLPMSLFAVVRTAPGLRVTTFPTLDGRVAAAVDFNSTPAYCLGAGDPVAGAYRRSVILAAAECCGLMQAVTTATARHLRDRRQFGQSLAQFQVLQHRMAEMHTQERESIAHVWEVARAYDERDLGLDRRLLRLRVQSARAARYLTQQAIQLHGAMGMTDELPIGDYYKRALTLTAVYLRPDEALDELAASVKDPESVPCAADRGAQ